METLQNGFQFQCPHFSLLNSFLFGKGDNMMRASESDNECIILFCFSHHSFPEMDPSLRTIGQGYFGKVYRTKYKGKIAALKKIPESTLRQSHLQREIEIYQ